MADLGFDSPWRVHWRLLGCDPAPVAGMIREAGPLAVTLEVCSPDELSGLELPWPNASFVVVLQDWKMVRDGLSGSDVARWEFPVTGPEEARQAAELHSGRLPPWGGAFRWLPVRGRLTDLPVMLELAAKNRFGVTLPNRRADDITARKEDVLPLPGEPGALDRDTVMRLVEELGKERIRVHDFILSQTMGLSTTEPGGCEAANALVFVDEAGDVYPCDSLRVRMGSLRRESLRDVWEKPIRTRIRRDVSSLPPVCSSCDVLPLCRGGCRGIAFHVTGHFGAPDMLCGHHECKEDDL
ncbi:MAG: SPASM domain-containing protein [bacterium]|nr:MAG: SPASM domain-containing protein [bacterium]